MIRTQLYLRRPSGVRLADAASFRLMLSLLLPMLLSLLLSLVPAWPAAAQVPDGFVDMGEFLADVQIEARYAGQDNFLGAKVDGYEAAKVLLTREAADALFAVRSELRQLGLDLKLFDGYRPQRAVDHFVRWAEDLEDDAMKPTYYPHVDKSDLFEQGYIAARSGHSRGSAIDLTLVSLDTGEELDMGTRWDFFDPRSAPASPEISLQQRARRMLLQVTMMKHGFEPIDSEWWHFYLRDEPYPETYFDFAIE